MPASRGRPFLAIETWIFDVDNTLYPASCRLFDQIQKRMQRFVALRLELSPEAALGLQKRYFRQYGTTMRGLMTVDDKSFEVGPGTAVLTRPGSSHGLKQIGTEDLVIMLNYEQAVK